MVTDPHISIGVVAALTGIAASAIRYYESIGLLPAIGSAGGKRLFPRSVIRRVSFILISQQMGYTLEEIASLLDKLPQKRTPTKADWQKLSVEFSRDIDQRIERLTRLKESLSGFIGCECLSLKSCGLYNPQDQAGTFGDSPRYWLGDCPVPSCSDLAK